MEPLAFSRKGRGRMEAAKKASRSFRRGAAVFCAAGENHSLASRSRDEMTRKASARTRNIRRTPSPAPSRKKFSSAWLPPRVNIPMPMREKAMMRIREGMADAHRVYAVSMPEPR